MEEKESLKSRPISFSTTYGEVSMEKIKKVLKESYHDQIELSKKAVFVNLDNGEKVFAGIPRAAMKPKASKTKSENKYFVFEAISIMKDSRCKKYFEVSQEKSPRNSLRTVATIRELIDTGANWGALDYLFSENNMSKLYDMMKKIDISKESLDDLADKFESMIGDTKQFDEEYEVIMKEIEDEL